MSRVFEIVNILINSNEYITIDAVAESLKVSNKTIRNDLKQVNEYIELSGLNLSKKPGVGIKISGPDDKKLCVLNEIKTRLMKVAAFSPEARKNYILKRLFMSDANLTMQELGDELYVSRVTIYKDLSDVESWLKKFNLKLIKKTNYGIEIQGEEENWRNAISSLIATEKEEIELKELLYDDYEGKIDYKTITKLKELINLDYKIIEKIVYEAEKELKLNFSDEAYISLVMHIAISIKRLKDGKDINLSEEILNNLQMKNEYLIAKKIANQISETFKVNLPESEIGYILLHILGTKMQEKTPEKVDLNLELDKENELAVLMSKEIISIAQRALSIDLGCDIQLLNGLILHLRPTINRLRYGLTLRNPILNEIKESYPEIFGAAWMTSLVFEKYLDVKIQEEEIGYIALHIGAAVERNRNTIRTLVVCTSGIGTSQLLAARLKRSFKQIEIADIVSSIALEEKSIENIELIISTVPIKSDKPVLNISPLLNQTDIKRLECFLDDLTGKKENDFYGMLDVDFIYNFTNITDKLQLLNFICDDLLHKGVIREGFLESLLQREKISSTEIGNGISIPHGNPQFVNRSKMVFAKLDKPISWEGEEVDLVFLLCISINDIYKSKELFRQFSDFLESDSKIKFLRMAKDKHELKRILEG